jgi:hypothetical protein
MEQLSDATGSIKSGQLITPDLIITISPACHCQHCKCPIYEEEIMAGWSNDASCMWIKCPWCAKVSFYGRTKLFK